LDGASGSEWCSAVALDVADSKAVTDFVAAVETRLGQIDICVTNSGGLPSNLFRNTPPEAWRAALGPASDEHLCVARETLPRLQKNKWRRLITTTLSMVVW
jgi:3-oxoacyl-[acyl-carrier protein] reductase